MLGNPTEEQRKTIKLRIQEMREAEASWLEIKAEITGMLQEWGVEVPEFNGPPHRCR